MRTAIGLIGLGLIGGFMPTGLQGITYALPVLAGTAGTLTALVICCLASAHSVRRARLAGHFLHDGDGALAYESDGHRVGGAVTGQRGGLGLPRMIPTLR